MTKGKFEEQRQVRKLKNNMSDVHVNDSATILICACQYDFYQTSEIWRAQYDSINVFITSVLHF